MNVWCWEVEGMECSYYYVRKEDHSTNLGFSLFFISVQFVQIHAVSLLFLLKVVR